VEKTTAEVAEVRDLKVERIEMYPHLYKVVVGKINPRA
jgi:hypothetical protein